MTSISEASSLDFDERAHWIWRPEVLDDYNSWMLARRTFEVDTPVAEARLCITADTRYQLYINGDFVSDGPVRAFPAHYRYDPLDVSRFLRQGKNVIAVRVHHWGRDTAQSIAVQGGLLAQLRWRDSAGDHRLGTDSTWKTRNDPAHDPNSGVVSAHLGFEEQYDARKALSGWRDAGFDDSEWRDAVEIAPAFNKRWQDLQPREIPQLDSELVLPVAVLSAKKVCPPRIVSTINVGRCQGIDRKENNPNVHRFVLMTNIISERAQKATLCRPSAGFRFGLLRFPEKAIDVKKELLDAERMSVSLKKGINPLVVVLNGRSEVEEFQFILDAPHDITLRNPLGQGEWAISGPHKNGGPAWRKVQQYQPGEMAEPLKPLFRTLESREIVSPDVHALTSFRRDLGSIKLARPENMFFDNEECAIIPAGNDNIELMIDLGKEYNAHIGFELSAPKGVVLDGNILERIHEAGPQWSWKNRSSFRYTTRMGWQNYVTMRHFGGRFLALTIRERPEPVRIRLLSARFKHYPVADRGRFATSDPLLNEIWSVCRQTMLACMEDTFVDCPLYEQSLWLGDARNEALVCYSIFGDAQLVRRCCILGAESLEYSDLTHMRVPTRWGRIIPAWSFLWARMCWENYRYTGDRDTLAEIYYPGVKQMVENCLEKYIDEETGLFSITAWNFFDWIGLDTGHRRVTHNNIFLVETCRIAARMAETLGDAEAQAALLKEAERLKNAINEHCWDATKRAYVDSVHDDGSLSPNVSMQINTLALLYDIAPPECVKAIVPIVLGRGGPEVTPFGSPFATLYQLEYLGESGRVETMLDVIRSQWGSMLDGQTTTFWESFPVGNLGGEKYPTRSYCHAWSSGPAYMFSRYVLGVRLDAIRGANLTITPRLDLLARADGVVPFPDSEAKVAWRGEENGTIRLRLALSGESQAKIQLPRGWREIGTKRDRFTLSQDEAIVIHVEASE